MFAGGVGRIFTEFDEFLNRTYTKTNKDLNKSQIKKKNRSKLANLIENFFEEIVCLLNIDRNDYERAKIPWSFIFHNRAISAQTLLPNTQHALYKEAIQDYHDFTSASSKLVKKKELYLKNAAALLNHLNLHEVDPDGVLIGLSPSDTIVERFNEYMENHPNGFTLDEPVDKSDNMSLGCFNYPARKGDLVVAKILPDQLSNDLRKKSFIIDGGQQDKDPVMVIGRIKDALDFNKTTFLVVFIAPKEDKPLTINAHSTVPLKKLVPGISWIGNAAQMRDLVADPYNEFNSFIKFKMTEILHNLLSNTIDIKLLHSIVKQSPISFKYYHTLNEAGTSLNNFVNATDTINPQLFATRNQFIENCITASKNELQKFIEEINQQDGTTNKLFMPTCEQDLMRLNRLCFKTIANNFLIDFANSTNQAIAAIESERKELMKGNLKNQISKWWLLLIKTRTEVLLSEVNYDSSACNEDNYIDIPPANIDSVKGNLQIVQNLLNVEHPSHEKVCKIVNEIKSEVYPVIDDFILKAHIVLSYELLDIIIEYNYSAANFDIERVKNALNTKKDKLSPEVADQYDDLIKDLRYLTEMKKLEIQTANSAGKKSANGKLELSYAVPLSGLVMGSFFRLENVLKTIIELWAPKTPRLPTPVPVPSIESDPSTVTPSAFPSPSASSTPVSPSSPPKVVGKAAPSSPLRSLPSRTLDPPKPRDAAFATLRPPRQPTQPHEWGTMREVKESPTMPMGDMFKSAPASPKQSRATRKVPKRVKTINPTTMKNSFGTISSPRKPSGSFTAFLSKQRNNNV